MSKNTRTLSVLLMEDVSLLGKTGEVVEVAPGYARNYLLPSGIAIQPSKEGLKQVELHKARKAADQDAQQAALRELAERIPSTNITLEMKASPEGHLFGSVTSEMIAQAMQNAGLDIPAANVRLESHIKEIGQHPVPIHVYGDINVEARIWVVKAAD
jgi:large subunit ribosomal protein L9